MDPPEGTSTGRPCCAGFVAEGRKTGRTAEHKKKTMKSNKSKKAEAKRQGSEPSEQSSTGKTGTMETRPPINLAMRRANQALGREQLLTLMRSNAPDFFAIAEIVGKWVWIQFPEKQPQQVTRVLAELGFFWNNTRQCWQHAGGTLQTEASTFDPRKRYGSRFAADEKPA